MSNRTDWKALTNELLEGVAVFGHPLWEKFRERIETELHNAFVAGQENVEHRQEPQARHGLRFNFTPESGLDVRYRHDSHWKAVVDLFQAIIAQHQYTPSEVREAVLYACLLIEMRAPKELSFGAIQQSLERVAEIKVWLEQARTRHER